MDYAKLYELNSPTFFVAVMDSAAFKKLFDKLGDAYSSKVTRLIDGDNCGTKADFFKQIGEALEFPDFFGSNWDAFNDMVSDLSWLEGDAYLLMVENATDLLSSATDRDFNILLETFADIHAENRNLSLDDGEEYAALHVLFQCTPAQKADFVSRLEEAEVDFEIF